MTTPIPPEQPVVATDARLQLLIEAVVDYGIFLLDREGHVVSWNTGAERLKGYKAAEIIGRHFSVFYPQEAVEAGWPAEELRRASLFGRLEDEGWRLRKDGSRFWANVTITPIRDAGGVLTGFAKVTRDLTERRAQEEALRASEERVRLLVSSVRDYAIFMLDEDGFIRSWNAGAQSIYGYEPAEVIGRHFRTFYTPQDQNARKPETELAIAQAEGRVEDEGWRVRKDGTLYWANAVITVMRAADGGLRGFAKVTRDMTERRKLEELERSSRRVNEFLAMLAHELRNPLAPIRNAVTLMQLEKIASPSVQKARDIIDRQLTHVTRLVDDLLDISRIATGKVKLMPTVVSVADIVSASVETARPLIDSRGHELTVHLPAEPVHVAGDATRLSQVLQNLLVNAAKYTPAGGRIEIATTLESGFVAIRVKDNGRGIASSQLEAVFELFRQGDEQTPAESGLGIGLTLSRTLAEMHGGSLEAFSEGPGKGSTFTFRIPLAKVPPPAAVPGARPAVADLRVLVVDDNRDSADSALAILRALGNEAECVYSGPDALAAAQRLAPDVILLDIAMPGLSGFETLERLRRQESTAGAFIIAMTGYGGEDDRRRTYDAGFDAHLTKPVELEALLKLLVAAREKSGAGSAPD